MKTAISVPDPVFSAAERLARKLGISRSQLYSAALRQFIEEHDEAAITAKLNDVYTTESSELDPVFKSIQSRSLAREPWK